jgi:hypothetical protein
MLEHLQVRSAHRPGHVGTCRGKAIHRLGAALFVALFTFPVFAQVEAGASPRDAHAIAQLRDAGSDLARPHRIDFFLYFDEEATARHFADGFVARDFTANVTYAEDRGAWQVRLSRAMVPSESALGALRLEFQRACENDGGSYDGCSYDGWGAAIVR